MIDKLKELFSSIGDFFSNIFNFFGLLLNAILGAIGAILNFVFGLLPPSPFSLIDNSAIKEYLPSLNYLFPIQEMIVIFEAWIACIAVYYVYKVVMRWLKLIQ